MTRRRTTYGTPESLESNWDNEKRNKSWETSEESGSPISVLRNRTDCFGKYQIGTGEGVGRRSVSVKGPKEC